MPERIKSPNEASGSLKGRFPIKTNSAAMTKYLIFLSGRGGYDSCQLLFCKKAQQCLFPERADDRQANCRI